MTDFLSQFLYVYYREWAEKTHFEIALDLPVARTTEELLQYIEKSKSLKYIFFVGWSEIVPTEIINRFECYCIHPSKLPLYRGGSPIQHQIIDGVLDSSVTLFKMNDRIDSGPIFLQKRLSLRGTLDHIFLRISFISAELILEFISCIQSGRDLNLTIQREDDSSFFKRRKPHQSEITLEELQNATALSVMNKIRALSDPYPNAFIRFNDGSVLLIKKAELG